MPSYWAGGSRPSGSGWANSRREFCSPERTEGVKTAPAVARALATYLEPLRGPPYSRALAETSANRFPAMRASVFLLVLVSLSILVVLEGCEPADQSIVSRPSSTAQHVPSAQQVSSEQHAPSGMGGNVWEWTADWFRPYAEREQPFSVMETSEKAQRGGSFLCEPGWCHGYRVSGRSHATPETSLFHVGFRCVSTPTDDRSEPASKDSISTVLQRSVTTRGPKCSNA